MSQGIVNLDKIIESCHCLIQRMKKMKEKEGGISSELQAAEPWGGQLEGLRDKFFMKTVAAFPATKKCLEGVEKVLQALNDCQDLPEPHSLVGLKQALAFLADAVEELLNKAEMRGTTLT